MDEKTAKAIANNIRILVENVTQVALIDQVTDKLKVLREEHGEPNTELSANLSKSRKEVLWHANKAEANIAKMLQEGLPAEPEGEKSVSKAKLIEFGKEAIRPMQEPRPGPPGLLGFTGTVGFICSTCSGKLVERGIALKQFADEPVWKTEQPEPVRTCVLCDKKV